MVTTKACPHKWKIIIKQNPGDVSYLVIQDHDLLKGTQILTLEKPSPKELYSILIIKCTNKASSNVYFEKMKFDGSIGERFIYCRV